MRRKIRLDCSPAVTQTSVAPLVINIDNATEGNNAFRNILWTGEHLQVTLMSVPIGGEIGVEMHPDADQFIKIESGNATVMTGESETDFNYQRIVDDDFAIVIPAGTWHNVVNSGDSPLKLFSVYAPPQH